MCGQAFIPMWEACTIVLPNLTIIYTQPKLHRVLILYREDLKGRHNIQFGILYEQSINSNYSISPFDLWRLGRLYQNDHITGVDPLNIIGYDTLPDGIVLPIFQTLVIEQEDRNF